MVEFNAQYLPIHLDRQAGKARQQYIHKHKEKAINRGLKVGGSGKSS